MVAENKAGAHQICVTSGGAGRFNDQTNDSLGHLLDCDHRIQATDFLKNGVCSSTSAGYAGDWKHWEKFDANNGSTDIYLRSIEGNDSAKATVWT